MSELEIIGDEIEIIGDDDDLDDLLGDDGGDDGDDGDGEFVGAAIRRGTMRGARRAIQVSRGGVRRVASDAMAQKIARQGAVLRRRPYQDLMKTFLGFESDGNVAAGDPVTLTIKAVSPTRPNRLIVPSSIGANFELTRLSFGYRNFLAGTSGVPGILFSEETSPGGDDGTGFFKLPTMPTGTELVMVWRNVTAAEAKLRGAWLCSVVA
jgi:hypothetical protein